MTDRTYQLDGKVVAYRGMTGHGELGFDSGEDA